MFIKTVHPAGRSSCGTTTRRRWKGWCWGDRTSGSSGQNVARKLLTTRWCSRTYHHWEEFPEWSRLWCRWWVCENRDESSISTVIGIFMERQYVDHAVVRTITVESTSWMLPWMRMTLSPGLAWHKSGWSVSRGPANNSVRCFLRGGSAAWVPSRANSFTRVGSAWEAVCAGDTTNNLFHNRTNRIDDDLLHNVLRETFVKDLLEQIHEMFHDLRFRYITSSLVISSSF